MVEQRFKWIHSAHALCYGISEILCFHAFYRSNYIETKEEEWAVKSENGTWFGMIGMVARREADAAVGGLTMYSSRLNLVDFLIPLMIDK